jgi:hypothetical protein
MRNNKGFDFELGQRSCATQASLGAGRGGCRVRHEALVAPAPAFLPLSRRALLVSSSSIDATNARCLITFHFVHSKPQNPFAAFGALRSICILNGNHSLRRRRRRGTGTVSSVSILRKELDGKKAQKVLETKAL